MPLKFALVKSRFSGKFTNKSGTCNLLATDLLSASENLFYSYSVRACHKSIKHYQRHCKSHQHHIQQSLSDIILPTCAVF